MTTKAKHLKPGDKVLVEYDTVLVVEEVRIGRGFRMRNADGAMYTPLMVYWKGGEWSLLDPNEDVEVRP